MIILKNEFGDFIYLDVVTRYSQSFNSKVSQHPVDGSGTVSDHVTKNNPRIQLTGFISGADFNTSKPTLSSEDRAFIGIDRVVVDSEVADAISINYEDNPYNLLPDVAGQFFTDTLPEVNGLSEGRDAIYSEKVLLSVLQDFYARRYELQLFEFDGPTVVEEIPELFITGLSVNETAENGDALAFDITLERVTFANLLEEEIPEEVRPDFEKRAEQRENKGGETPESIFSFETNRESALSAGTSNRFEESLVRAQDILKRVKEQR